MLRVSFQVRESWDTIAWGVEQYQNFFTESYYWRTFVRTGVMSLFTTLLTLLVAFPIAWYIARMARGRAKGILFMACLIPFWARSEEHTSELQSRENLVCRLLLEK